MKKLILTLLVVGSCFISCKKEIENLPTISPTGPILNGLDSMKCEQFIKALENIGRFRQPSPADSVSTNNNVSNNNDYVCIQRDVLWNYEYNEINVLDPKSDVHVGGFYDLSGISTGTPKIFSGLERDSITISMSSPSLKNQKPFIKILSTLSAFREGLNELRHGAIQGSNTGIFTFKLNKIQAEEEVMLHLGVGGQGWGATVKANYDFTNQKKRSRYMVIGTQKYYSIDVDAQSPCEMFKTGKYPNVSVFGNTMPVQITTITYGRAVYFFIESFESEETTAAALNASFSKFGFGGTIELSYKDKQTLSSCTMSALVVGGPAESGVKTINGLEGLKSYITEGAKFSLDNPGVPIAYNLRYLTGGVAKLIQASKYTIKECKFKGTPYEYTPQGRFDFCPKLNNSDGEWGGNGPEVSGSIRLFDTLGGREIWADVQATYIETNNGSKAYVSERVRLFALPQGKKFNSFPYKSNITYFHYIDTNHSPDFPRPDGEFIEKIESNGDTDGDDLPCVGYDKDRSYLALWFKSVKVLLEDE